VKDLEDLIYYIGAKLLEVLIDVDKLHKGRFLRKEVLSISVDHFHRSDWFCLAYFLVIRWIAVRYSENIFWIWKLSGRVPETAYFTVFTLHPAMFATFL
jgi:hypothetical protein